MTRPRHVRWWEPILPAGFWILAAKLVNLTTQGQLSVPPARRRLSADPIIGAPVKQWVQCLAPSRPQVALIFGLRPKFGEELTLMAN